MQRKYFMFKSDLSCLKAEIYFTSCNSVGKPAYPAAQVEVPSLTLSDSSLPLSPRASLPQARWLRVEAYLQAIWVRSSSFLPPRPDVSTFLSIYRKGFVIALCICALAPVQALLYNAAMLHICISAPLCAPQLLQLEWNSGLYLEP